MVKIWSLDEKLKIKVYHFWSLCQISLLKKKDPWAVHTQCRQILPCLCEHRIPSFQFFTRNCEKFMTIIYIADVLYGQLWQFWKSFHNSKSWNLSSIDFGSIKGIYILYWYIHTRVTSGGKAALVLDWILRNTKRQQQWLHTGEVSATMASLPAKNIQWQPCIQQVAYRHSLISAVNVGTHKNTAKAA